MYNTFCIRMIVDNCRCCADVVEGVGQLLQHVPSIKALASIKMAVHSLLSAPPCAPGSDGSKDDGSAEHAQWEKHWTNVCMVIINKDISVWETFFGPSLLKRVHVRGSCGSLLELSIYWEGRGNGA